MAEELLIANNPEEGTTLPFLIRLPVGADVIVLKVRETWPRTAKVYCHRVADWPVDAEIIERLPIRPVSKRGAAIDLVLERGRENRSQFVLTRARGREMVFWQSRRTAKQARPNVTVSRARAHGLVPEIIVDTREQYAYKFSDQQATTVKRALPVGDYAVFDDDELVAVAERKSIEDLAGSSMSGKLDYLLADLTARPRAALIVDSGYSALFKLEHVNGSAVADAVAEAQARFPSVPIIFCENRKMAQEWLYRWFGACLHEHALHAAAPGVASDDAPVLKASSRTDVVRTDTRAVRRWARQNGIEVSDRGRIPSAVTEAYAAAQSDRCGDSAAGGARM